MPGIVFRSNEIQFCGAVVAAAGKFTDFVMLCPFWIVLLTAVLRSEWTPTPRLPRHSGDLLAEAVVLADDAPHGFAANRTAEQCPPIGGESPEERGFAIVGDASGIEVGEK